MPELDGEASLMAPQKTGGGGGDFVLPLEAGQKVILDLVQLYYWFMLTVTW